MATTPRPTLAALVVAAAAAALCVAAPAVHATGPGPIITTPAQNTWIIYPGGRAGTLGSRAASSHLCANSAFLPGAKCPGVGCRLSTRTMVCRD